MSIYSSIELDNLIKLCYYRDNKYKKKLLNDNLSKRKINNLIKINYNNLLKYETLKNSSTELNNQISYCYYKNNDYRNRLLNIIFSKIKLSDFNKEKFIKLIKEKQSDLIIYNFLRNNSIKKYKKTSGYLFMNDIKTILESIKQTNIRTYLDFGAGEGIKTLRIMELLNLKSENVYGLDVEQFFSVSNLQNNTTYNKILYDGKNIPKIKIKNFDLITITHVLHHIKNIDNILEQLDKLTHKGTILIIKEHDLYESDFAKLIDIEHAIYELVLENNTNFLDNYFARYYNKNELISLFINRNYKYIKTTIKKFNDNTNSMYFVFIKK